MLDWVNITLLPDPLLKHSLQFMFKITKHITFVTQMPHNLRAKTVTSHWPSLQF